MLKIENVEVFGWEAAIRGMRNPKNSWEKSDTVVCLGECIDCQSEYAEYPGNCPCNCDNSLTHAIGSNDLKLMKALAKAGSDHGKFLRMINVTCDITAPLYWWKEFDTYKVGTVANSCSTMHKIHDKEFTFDDFSHEHVVDMGHVLLMNIIGTLNDYRRWYLRSKDKEYWWQMIQLLPTSYNQKRTVQFNYEVLRAMDRPGRRKDHKLDEWREFCAWAETLPYFKDICIQGDK